MPEETQDHQDLQDHQVVQDLMVLLDETCRDLLDSGETEALR